MNCWGIRTYFTKWRFSLNGGYIVYMKLLSGHEKIITKPGISLNAGTLNRGFTVLYTQALYTSPIKTFYQFYQCSTQQLCTEIFTQDFTNFKVNAYRRNQQYSYLRLYISVE